MAENLRYQRKYCHFDALAAREKNAQKGMFFRYSVTPPHPTAKPSWGWLRVGVRKPRSGFSGVCGDVEESYGGDTKVLLAQWWLMAMTMICGDPETRHVE